MITIRRIDTQEKEDVLGVWREGDALWTIAGEGQLWDALECTGEYHEECKKWERVELLPGWEIVSP